MHQLYTPADMAAAFSTQIPVVLAWVGAGVGAAIVLMLAFLGIRKAFEFFQGLGYDRILANDDGGPVGSSHSTAPRGRY